MVSRPFHKPDRRFSRDTIPRQLQKTMDVMSAINRKTDTLLLNTDQIVSALIEDVEGEPQDPPNSPEGPGAPGDPDGTGPVLPGNIPAEQWEDLVMTLKADIIKIVMEEIMPFLEALQRAERQQQQYPQPTSSENALLERLQQNMIGKIKARQSRYEHFYKK